MLRSSLTAASVLVLAFVSTGCAGKLRTNAGASLGAYGSGHSAPSVYGQGYAGATGGAQGNVGATSGAQASTGAYGGAQASTGAYGGAQGYGGAHGGGYTAATGGGSGQQTTAGVPVAPWKPVFYGIPLAGAQDVIFVLDRSGSMSASSMGVASGAPVNPLAAIAAFGLQAASTARTAATLLPAAWPSRGTWSLNNVLPATQSKMDAAKAELIGAIAALPDNTRFNVVFFNETTAAHAPQMIVMSPMARLNAITFVSGVDAGGSTAAVPALRSAYSSRPYRVVFLSDGLANTGGSSHDLLAEARVEMRRGVRFDTVGVGSDQDAALMRSLATESGGQTVQR
jgi:hypothetical protein